MKLASYIAGGKAAFGVVADDGVVTMNGRLKSGAATLREALAAGALGEIREAANGAKPDHKLSDIRFLPVIPDPQKILCAGINYRSHAAEVGRELPKQPSMFIRFTDTLVGHDGEMIRPRLSDNFDFEGEFTVVIGKGGRDIPVERALDHAAGYTCFVDGSVRDYQKFSVTSGKNFPGTGPLGPWIVTTDEIPDPTKLTLTTRLNGHAGAAFRHRPDDLLGAADHRVLFAIHAASARRRHRHRHARGRRPWPQAAALDEAGRCAGGRDQRHRHAAHARRRRKGVSRLVRRKPLNWWTERFGPAAIFPQGAGARRYFDW